MRGIVEQSHRTAEIHDSSPFALDAWILIPASVCRGCGCLGWSPFPSGVLAAVEGFNRMVQFVHGLVETYITQDDLLRPGLTMLLGGLLIAMPLSALFAGCLL